MVSPIFNLALCICLLTFSVPEKGSNASNSRKTQQGSQWKDIVIDSMASSTLTIGQDIDFNSPSIGLQRGNRAIVCYELDKTVSNNVNEEFRPEDRKLHFTVDDDGRAPVFELKSTAISTCVDNNSMQPLLNVTRVYVSATSVSVHKVRFNVHLLKVKEIYVDEENAATTNCVNRMTGRSKRIQVIESTLREFDNSSKIIWMKAIKKVFVPLDDAELR